MIAVIIPAVLFLLIAAILNGKLLLKEKYGYDEKAYLFIPLLITASVGLLVYYDLSVSIPTKPTLFVLICLVGVYLSFSFLWNRTLPTSKVYGLETIPKANQSIVKLNPLADTTKLFEIFFQDIVALTIVVALTKIAIAIDVAIIILATIVFVVHLPGLKLFGKVFGTFWLIASTALAPAAYYLLSFEQGLYYLFILHASSYLLLYGFIYFLSKTRLS